MLITSDHYPKSYDTVYRVGFLIQLAGILGMFAERFFPFLKAKAVTAALPPAHLGFALGVLVSAWFLLVWDIRVKKFILANAFLGAVLSILFFTVNGASSPLLGAAAFGITAVAAAGLVGKEAYCFRFIEGWILLAYYPLLTLLIYLEGAGVVHNWLWAVFGIWLALKVSFVFKKLRKPLMECQAGQLK